MVLNSPNVTLKAPFINSSFKPIAFKTCDGLGSFELHADPLEAQIPTLSNSNNKSLPFTPSKDILAFPGSLAFLAPFIFISGILFITSFI